MIEKKYVSTKYWPTEEIIVYLFSNPLQGSLFYKLRNRMINTEDWYQPKNMWDHRSVLVEISALYLLD